MDYNKMMSLAADISNAEGVSQVAMANTLIEMLGDEIQDRTPVAVTNDALMAIHPCFYPSEETGNTVNIFNDVTDGNYAAFLEQYPDDARDAIAIIFIIRYLIRTLSIQLFTDALRPLLSYTSKLVIQASCNPLELAE